MTILKKIYWKLYRKLSGDQRIIPLPQKFTKDFQDPTKLKVFILTYCKNIQQLYGTTLIFQSIRTGFPNASITVIDNASVPSARKEIKRLAAENRCQFFQIETEIPHYTYLEDLIMNQPLAGTVVNLDPDIVLWKDCEHWHFNALLAGTLMPTSIDEWTQCIVKPRIHTCFCWIQDINKLRVKIESLTKTYLNEFNAFRPITYKDNDHWYRFDTCGTLYTSIKDSCYIFRDEEHKAFDHLFGGTHIDRFIDSVKIKKTKNLLLNVHKLAKNEPAKLRGVWKKQFQQLRKV